MSVSDWAFVKFKVKQWRTGGGGWVVLIKHQVNRLVNHPSSLAPFPHASRHYCEKQINLTALITSQPRVFASQKANTCSHTHPITNAKKTEILNHQLLLSLADQQSLKWLSIQNLHWLYSFFTVCISSSEWPKLIAKCKRNINVIA